MDAPHTARAIRDAVQRGQRRAVDVVRDALDLAHALNPRLNTFLELFDERALSHAAWVDAHVAAGKGLSLPLAGVPVAIKDNICLGPDLFVPGDAIGYAGRTTCASKMLAEYRSPFTATAAQRLVNAGAILLGKTNMDEFAMGSSTEHSAFGPALNPHDPTRVPGGSSGGSSAAVAAGICPLALGSDTGGSIRQPAALCGVVGVKPTYGRVSRLGLVAFASSLDQIGPMARDTTDAALALEAICGLDRADSTSAPHAVPAWGASIDDPVRPLVIGVPRQARNNALHPDMARAFEAAISACVRAGASIREIDLPLLDEAVAAYYIVAPAEASSNLARYDGVRYGRRASLAPGEGLDALYERSRSEGFGDEVKRRIMLGTHVLSSGYHDAYYATACRARRRLLDEFNAAFASGCHCVLTPTTTGPAFRLGEKSSNPLAMYLEDVFTVAANLAGLPAMSLPAGHAVIDGVPLPLGVQLIAPAFAEDVMLRTARMLERELPALIRPGITP